MEESQFTEAKNNLEVGSFLNKMDCGHYYNIAIGDFDRAEDNYEEFGNMEKD
jgi:hypothetical protein